MDWLAIKFVGDWYLFIPQTHIPADTPQPPQAPQLSVPASQI